MTEYDYSPEAQERWQANMRRISRWVDDAEAHASEFKSPFVPRSDVGDDDVPPRPVLTRGMSTSKRVPTPLYAPVPGPMPPHSHGPAPPPPRPPQVPLHGPAPPPSHSRHSPTRHSSTRRSSSHPPHSKHRSGSYYVSPTPTPPPVPYYPGYNNPYYQPRPSPYAPPPPPQPQYYRSGNVAYAPPPGGYVVIPNKGRSSKVVSSVQPVVFSTSSSTDSEPQPPPHRQPHSGSFLQKVFPFNHNRRESPAPAVYDHQREHRPHHHHHHHHHRHTS
ncbi:hypothetical protein EDD18DRAFT_1181871 [Armillaria luteobubalina]|uniref:Uncharacterized protein n=1 Tax=Armillaria luteobubalina TaxID=153913 RepID=A0AA39PZH7_9AGAR|nr:hypothetical protein EDD18DRAFT_1181871 [Armillaria luteobubalina]